MKNRIAGLILIAGLGLAGGSSAVAQVSFGVRIGPPPAVRIERVRPRRPGDDFVWVNGYWYPLGNRYQWHNGYWTRPPYQGANWIGPRYEGDRFQDGRWEGDRGAYIHDHQWDRARERDYGRNDDRYRDRREDNRDRDDRGRGNGRGRGNDRNEDRRD